MHEIHLIAPHSPSVRSEVRRCCCAPRATGAVFVFGLRESGLDRLGAGMDGCIPLLVQHGALLEAQVLDKPPLLWAAIKGRTACASCLLQLRARVDGAAPNGLTPLVAASKQGNTSLVKLLCSAKAALDACITRGGESALMAAAKVVSCFVLYCCCHCAKQVTPCVIQEGFSSTAAALLSFNAALDSHQTSKAPLLLAAENGWLSTVEVAPIFIFHVNHFAIVR